MTEFAGDPGSELPRLEKWVTCTRLQSAKDSITLSEYLPGVQRVMKTTGKLPIWSLVVWSVLAISSWLLLSAMTAIIVAITAVIFILLGTGPNLRKRVRKRVTSQYLANVTDPDAEMTSHIRIDECGIANSYDGITTILSWESVEHAVEIAEGIILIARHDAGNYLKRDEIGDDFPVWRDAIAAYLDRDGRVPLECGPGVQ